MSLYILRDDQNRFLNKERSWVYTCPADQLFCARHRDEALNLLIEINAKDISLRAQVIACDIDQKGRPRLAATPENNAGEALSTVAESAAA